MVVHAIVAIVVMDNIQVNPNIHILGLLLEDPVVGYNQNGDIVALFRSKFYQLV